MVGGPQHYQCSTFLPDNLVFYVKHYLGLEYSSVDQLPVAQAIRSMHKAGYATLIEICGAGHGVAQKPQMQWFDKFLLQKLVLLVWLA